MTSYYYKKHIARRKMKIYGKRIRKAPPKCGVAILCTNNQNKLKASYENTHKPGRHLSIKIEMESSSFILTNI